ncbi:hypothetical protein [Flavilitoribacter nigricans]|uniref:Uncharacterized protein n=1 Tax=Flavilitoribacter nigricans (strain ATCC 23147 / DSM 23189 / NBRC 102662 / NCIMB 1420 / SS-2) TaxID=1122177 RepID=A0A2D0N5U8_FLAN2|nr:hypothetical protein [Flavilitoribacter nigricans]PHN03902.1 hypothetical protein CRP01_23810 [Flavilitoribacter nigricans DSM 23189 = NBRC 102662]
MSKFWKEPQNVIALGVTLISVCALIVSITQTRIMIRQSELMDVQARASVRPILQINKYQAFDPKTKQLTEYRLVAANGGVGPATIDELQVEYKGKQVNDWWDIFATMDLHDSIPDYLTTGQLNNTVIQAGQAVTFLDLTDNIALARIVYRSLDSIKMSIRYSSIYGDEFEGTLSSDGWTNKALD